MGKKKRSASQLAKSNKYQKRQQRYFSKKKNDKMKPVPNKMSNAELENWKKYLEPMVEEANKRIELIKASGYTSYALDRVEREGGRDYFDLTEVSTREELLKELTRMRVFINDKGSTVEGAKLDTAQIYSAEYKGKFGNEYNNEENEFARFDIKFIDKDIASRAFSNYRRIEERRQSEIVGDGAYGSENLIIAMYDAEVRGLDSLVYGMDLLDTFEKINKSQWKKAKRDADSIVGISGIVEDNITGGYNF